jgi:hypothetical protein
MPYLRVEIVRFVHDYQPGIVACEFADAGGLIHTIIDKAPIFTADPLDWDSSYPRSGYAECEGLRSFEDSIGRRLVEIRTLETTDGLIEHVVLAEAVLPTAPEGWGP